MAGEAEGVAAGAAGNGAETLPPAPTVIESSFGLSADGTVEGRGDGEDVVARPAQKVGGGGGGDVERIGGGAALEGLEVGEGRGRGAVVGVGQRAVQSPGAGDIRPCRMSVLPLPVEGADVAEAAGDATVRPGYRPRPIQPSGCPRS